MKLTTPKRIRALLGALVLCSINAVCQQQVIPLYPGDAPGSEEWKQHEAIVDSPITPSTHFIRNVVHPTLTVFLPKSNPTGTAIIVAPGGGFRFLSWESEGTQVAQWLAAHGIAAFVLKYRLIDTGTSDEAFVENVKAIGAAIAKNKSALPPPDPEMGKMLKLAGDDGRQAIRIIRQRASEWKIDPKRIGFMGFSAGGMVTDEVTFHHDADTRPDFVAPIYGAPLETFTVPEDAPPIFILCADDDSLFSAVSAKMYLAWHSAGKSAELHIYSNGGHGFGMQTHGLPTDRWIDLFGDWLSAKGLLKATMN